MSAYDTFKAGILGNPFDANKKPSRQATVQGFKELEDKVDNIAATAALGIENFSSMTFALAGTVEGQSFTIAERNDIVFYRNISGAGVEYARLATEADIDAVASDLSEFETFTNGKLSSANINFIATHEISSALSRVLKIQLHKSLTLPTNLLVQEIARDNINRFRFRLASFDGVSTYVELADEENGGGASLNVTGYTGKRWLKLFATNTDLGVANNTEIGRVLIDFGDGSAFGSYTTDITFAVGGIFKPEVQNGEVFETDVNSLISTKLAKSRGLSKPFADEVLGSEFLKSVITNIHLYGVDKSHQYCVSTFTIEEFTGLPLTRLRFEIYDITAAAAVCSMRYQVSSVPGISAFLADLPDQLKLTDFILGNGSKVMAVCEMDWSKVTGFFANVGSTSFATSGIHVDQCYSVFDLFDYQEDDTFHQVIRCGVGETFTTLRAAVESTYSPLSGTSFNNSGAPICEFAHYNNRVLIKLLDDAEFNATDLDIPDWVSIQGNGLDRTFIRRENTNADPILQCHQNSKVLDVTIEIETENQYCIHSDNINRHVKTPGNGVVQNAWLLQAFKRVKLISTNTHTTWLFGCGLSSAHKILFEDCIGIHEDLAASINKAPFGFHNIGPTISVPILRAGDEKSLVEMRGCSSPNQVGVIISTLEEVALCTISLHDCDFDRVKHIVSSNEVAGSGANRIQWAVLGKHEGSFENFDPQADTFTLQWYPDATPKRFLENNFGATLTAGKMVRLSGNNTVTICGANEKPHGWVPSDIADNANGYVLTGKRIHEDYLTGATAGSGEFGISATGEIDYTATNKIGEKIGDTCILY